MIVDTKKAEIVIIGGGVVGASVAYHLAERGCKDVLVLERENVSGQGSTGKATGGVRAQFETEINIRLSLYSIEFFRNWEHPTGYEARGYMFLATNEEQLELLRRSNRLQRSLGYHDAEILDPTEIKSVVPQIELNDVAGGSFGPRDGFIDPIAVLDGFIAGAERRGVQFKYGANALSIVSNTKGVRAVKTDEGVIECRAAVLCTGAWAKEVAAASGISLPVQPLCRRIVWARTHDPLPRSLPMVIDLSNGYHFRPAMGSDNEALVAGPFDEDNAATAKDIDDTFIDHAMKTIALRAPFFADAAVVREKCRSGFYELTPDRHAILGQCSLEGLYLANGFSGHGVMHSPATGRAIAEMILNGRTSFLDVSELELSRFERGEALHDTAFI